MTQGELNEMILQHELYLKTNGGEGEKAIFDGKNIKNLVIFRANLQMCWMKNVDFTRTIFDHCNLTMSSIERVDFSGCILRNVQFDNSILSNCSFAKASLDWCTANYATLLYTDFNEAGWIRSCQLDFEPAHSGVEETESSVTESTDSMDSMDYQEEECNVPMPFWSCP